MKQVDFKLPPIAGKLFQSRKTAFQKFDGTIGSFPHHRLLRILYIALLPVSVLISIPVIALKAKTYGFIEDNRDQGFMFETTEREGDSGVTVAMAALPRLLYLFPARLTLVAAVLSLFLGATHLAFVAIDWENGKRTQSWAFRRNFMFLHVANSILVLFALVSIDVTHKSSSHFRDGYVNFDAYRMDTNPRSRAENIFSYNMGTFDLENWACDLKDVRGVGLVAEDYAAQCNIEVAGRAIVVPFFIIAWLLAAISIWALVAGGRRGPGGEHVEIEDDADLEMGKMNAAST